MFHLNRKVKTPNCFVIRTKQFRVSGLRAKVGQVRSSRLVLDTHLRHGRRISRGDATPATFRLSGKSLRYRYLIKVQSDALARGNYVRYFFAGAAAPRPLGAST